ncbi:fimbria/pilus outer membrane usher protein [Enterobacter kobei]|uniref:fimbria/pilus outer membrane usher protein n=1 Tax=Enterobacter kobei TaxID=208224 RepID=UPI0020039A10|nr:fimbria/pilus outer membrane usher protein [Enterobacter kobei]
MSDKINRNKNRSDSDVTSLKCCHLQYYIKMTLENIKIIVLVILGCLSFQASAESLSPTDNIGSANESSAAGTEFNTDVLDVKDRSNINLNRFSRRNYIMPGEYSLTLKVNGSDAGDVTIVYLTPKSDPDGSEPCLTAEIVKLFGLKEKNLNDVKWNNNAGLQCLDDSSLPGMIAIADLGDASMKVTIPQAYMEFSTPNWDPPSRWDNGVAGVIADYYISVNKTNKVNSSGTENYSGNGVVGFNAGPWRVRGDWQAQRYSGNEETTAQSSWSRLYMYRAMPKLGAKLTLGETDLNSGLFDSFRFVGASLDSDDNMLPPNLRGYAPEVSGIARTNAKVIISQNGHVIYQTQVASGPFRIQDLPEGITGNLDVRVEEQDGTVQRFQSTTATIPYLTRPGMVRYKVAAGQPGGRQQGITKDNFLSSEFSWGITNGWSLYGGGVVSKLYKSLAVGIGRDLMALGAISFDITQSIADTNNKDSKIGRSYRLSYSKRFEELKSQITFAGYRFAEKDFMSMGDFIDEQRKDEGLPGSSRDKELYTLTFNQAFEDLDLSAYLSYSHKTYWNRPKNDRLTLTLAKTADIGNWKNISFNFSAYHSVSDHKKDDGIYLNMNVPWENDISMSFSAQNDSNGMSQSVGFSDGSNPNNQYQVEVGRGGGENVTSSAYLNHYGDFSKINAMASYHSGNYSAFGLSMQGGITGTLHGLDMHPVTAPGSTRLMLDTNGVGGVPVHGISTRTKSNIFGKAVLADLNSYMKSNAGIEVEKLKSDVDVSQPLTQLTLTEGAIGYRKMNVVAGKKMMATVELADGSKPPFGADVMRENHQVGVIGDDGEVWLTGIEPGARMRVLWDGTEQCQFVIQNKLPVESNRKLQVICGK